MSGRVWRPRAQHASSIGRSVSRWRRRCRVGAESEPRGWPFRVAPLPRPSAASSVPAGGLADDLTVCVTGLFACAAGVVEAQNASYRAVPWVTLALLIVHVGCVLTLSVLRARGVRLGGP